MEADFKGYATKANVKCKDGRTIMPDAFKHQDTAQVPLVWQHGHKDPENVLGHVMLENRPDGVYAYGFFNGTAKAEHTRMALEHGDFNALSIWANELVERTKMVFHGAIREVSLVLAGANPGALIESVRLRHDDGREDEILDDEAIIVFGETLEHSGSHTGDVDAAGDTGTAAHAEGDAGDEEETVQDIYESMSEKQKAVCHYMIGEALEKAGEAQHDALGDAANDTTDTDNTNDTTDTDTKGQDVAKHNVFENGAQGAEGNTNEHVLSHSDMVALVDDAKTNSRSLRAVINDYAMAHGIEDIDVLFPDAKAISDAPELFGRRVEWVKALLNGVRKSPFSRIKTLSADITVQEARAKGYIKGTLKKEEFFKIAKRVTTPTTIYKKQKLDRDDMVDITDFDVVAWLKGEMRLMLDEEIARAILVGDGRAVDDEDKIDEDRIRPVATDHEIYTTTLYVNIDDASSSMREVFDKIILNRSSLRGSGMPTMYTTETYIGKALTATDTLNRRLYRNLDELATELRVAAIVPVEVLEEYPEIVAVLFNPTDYVLGATAGGQVSMFEDFDIDYNQQKYLIETRLSGALTKLKSAMVVKKVAGTDALVAPAAPTFDGSAVTIVNTTGVVYRNADTDAVINAAGSPYAVAEGDTMNVSAEPAAGYYFDSSDNDQWSFTNEPA